MPTSCCPIRPDRPRGARGSHIAATVREVRHLVETTLMTYAEIAQRTGVNRGTIWHWSKHGKWLRPGFAPRSTHTVPAWRAGRTRKRRMLAVRLVALAERTVRALEAASAVDAARLREALALLAMAKLAAGPNTPRARLLAAVRPVAEAKSRARVSTPGKTGAPNDRRGQRAAPVRALDGMIEDMRQDGGPRLPHPAAITREDASIARRK